MLRAPSRHRRSVRLPTYDYSQAGAYFVTICTQDRDLFFDRPSIRSMAEACWLAIPKHFPRVRLDEWVVMPNHLHGIVGIEEGVRGGVQLNAPTEGQISPRDGTNPFSVISSRRGTLGVIVRTYKAAVTTSCRMAGYDKFAWQRNYYEHIIRSEADLDRVRNYIRDNPLNWETDENNPKNIGVSSR